MGLIERLFIIGTGSAGGALGLAALDAGLRVVGVEPGPSGRIPTRLAPFLHGPIGDADLVVIAVRDDQIDGLSGRVFEAPVVHLSGYVSAEALARCGPLHGSFHPLQTLPDAEGGAKALSGAHVAITTASAELGDSLHELARRLGMRPFDLADDRKPLYHAAASAAANHVVAALSTADALAHAAGVPFSAFRPLVDRVVANAFEDGPRSALTGPVARGDEQTVFGQLAASADVSEEVHAAFQLLTQATAHVARRPELASRIARRG